jgi:hypothetical protein
MQMTTDALTVQLRAAQDECAFWHHRALGRAPSWWATHSGIDRAIGYYSDALTELNRIEQLCGLDLTSRDPRV